MRIVALHSEYQHFDVRSFVGAGGVPPPQHPAFVQSLAWPTKAVAKQTAETHLRRSKMCDDGCDWATDVGNK